MRLHRLEITAFGPFADKAEVDFDELSSAGLFLLCGPTGAGKTSILDAVCFAVYGDVPGDRSGARRLRCDTAPDGRAPRVVLEATLSGRRFRITRSPQWSRPKKRGTGETTEQAKVLVEERVAGHWVALSTRIDEANHFLNGLVGMTLTQFCQVAMLPQGRFQAFLRARSDERHTLLQQLFGTRRFEDIEKWLRERSRILHRESRALLAEVGRVTSRILEVASSPAPEWLDLDDPGVPAESGDLAAWAADLLTASDQRRAAAELAVTSARDGERRATERLATATKVADLQRRHTDATAALERLAADAGAVEGQRARVKAARAAAPLVPLHRHALATSQQRDRLGERARSAAAAAAELLGVAGLVDEDLALAMRESRTLLTRAETMLPRQEECAELAAALTVAESRLVDVAGEHDQVVTRLEALPRILDGVRLEEGRARVAAAAVATAQSEERRLRQQRAARVRVPGLEAELADARARLAEAVGVCQARKEAWLDIREARLAGMAAEIAADLAVGACCPVCGSADHPAKAARAPGSPDAAAERAARSLVDDAEVTVTALEGSVRDLTTTLAVTLEQAGPASLDELEELVAAATDHAAALVATASALPTLEARADDLEQESAAHTGRAAALAAEQAELQAQIAGTTGRLRQLTTEIDELLAGSLATHLDELIGETTQRVEVIEAALQARRNHEAATAEAQRAAEALTAAVAELGFGAEEDALDHVMAADQLAGLEAQIDAHDKSLDAARRVLAEPDVAAAAGEEPPDLAALRVDDADARATHADTVSRLRAEQTRVMRLAALTGELTVALESWLPIREAHGVASGLAAFVEGKSVDNQLKMRLSAYVLAWRLTQVVAAANERLLRMSDQRYTLEHTDRRGVGEARGGLSMLVRDAWSGEARDPATLSGGETFVVSLALALGLADVVSGEAGGAALDTLFVDEGFGALDADTLDDVMDTLDALREGGRVVGVVSHVGEMKTRIPAQLQVAKARRGSTLRQVHALD